MTAHIDEDALKYILALPQGRKVLWDILGFAGLYRTPFIPGDRDLTGLNSGAHNVALVIWADCLTTSPKLTAMMTEEQGNDDNRDADAGYHTVDTPAERQPEPGSNGDPDPLNLGFDRSGG